MTTFKQVVRNLGFAFFRRIRCCLVPCADEIIHSLPEIFYKECVFAGIHEWWLIRHARACWYAEGECCLPLWFRREHAFPERHLYRLYGAELLSPFGGLRYQGKWLQESFGNYADVMWMVSRFRAERLFRFYFASRILYLSGGPYTFVKSVGYYHFLLCSLPELLHSLKRYPQVKVLFCHDKRYHFIDDFFDLLQIQERRILPLWSRVFVSDLVFSSVEVDNGFISLEDIALLRETFLPLAEVTGKETTGEKLFLSRRKSSRSFVNQPEIDEFMTKLGFCVVCLEEKSVLQQVCMFRSAKIVVANHGAGLSNLVWCNRDVSVVELFSPGFLNDCYFRLAKTLEMRYRYLIAEGDGWGTLDLGKLDELVGAPGC